MLNFGLLGGDRGTPVPAKCVGSAICLLVGTDGITTYGVQLGVPYGEVTPPTFGGVAIRAIAFNDDGSGSCTATMGDGTEQIPGITSLDFTWGTHAAVGFTWHSVNLRYEATSTTLVTYIKSELGNHVGGSAVPTNLILNPTFDVDLLNWTPEAGATISRTTDRFANGGCRVTATGSGATVHSTAVNLIVGQIYDVECDCFDESDNVRDFLAVISMNGNTQPSDHSDSNTTRGVVEHLKFSFTATNTTEEIFLSVLRVANYWGDVGDYVTYDNVSIKLR